MIATVDLAALAALLAVVLGTAAAGVCAYLGVRGLVRLRRCQEDNGTWLGPITAVAVLIVVAQVLQATGALS